MENCIYNSKEICTYDLKDKNSYYINDMVIEWKIAANSGKLICSECGQKVYLAAGPIKEPYFAHYDKQACTYGNQNESEELKKGKRLLYSLLKKSFPEYDIRARYKMENGTYSTCYVSIPDGEDIAIDYRLQNCSINKLLERDEYYKRCKIIPIYVLGVNKNVNKNQISWYGSIIEKSIGLSVYLDARNEEILLKRSFDYLLGNQRIVRYCEKIYPIEEILINREGTFACDFQEECNKVEQSIQAHINTYNQNIQNQKMKVYQSIENKSVEIRKDILNNALECLKRGEGNLVSKKYLDYIADHKLFREPNNNIPEENLEPVNNAESVNTIKTVKTIEPVNTIKLVNAIEPVNTIKPVDIKTRIIRNTTPDYKNSIFMSSLNEYWIMPNFKDEHILSPAQSIENRKKYLIDTDYLMSHIPEKDQLERYAESIIKSIEDRNSVKDWIKKQ